MRLNIKYLVHLKTFTILSCSDFDSSYLPPFMREIFRVLALSEVDGGVRGITKLTATRNETRQSLSRNVDLGM